MSKREDRKFAAEYNKVKDSFVSKLAVGQEPCTVCEGTGKVVSGMPLQGIDCYSCSGSGTRVSQLLRQIEDEKYQYNRLKEEHDRLLMWIKRTSKCTTCGGDQYKTLGMCNCKECGLEGMCPWPG